MKRAAILVIVLGSLAWLIVPNVLTVKNRVRQRQTMADMRSIATAWEARATDVNTYNIDHKQQVTADDMARVLEPKYVLKLPRKDGWGNPFRFTISGDGQTYVIRSLGSDGRPDRNLNLASGATKKFTDDIVYSNGSFTRYPEESG
jgi:type II secretory pathway pseudopilin PulG